MLMKVRVGRINSKIFKAVFLIAISTIVTLTIISIKHQELLQSNNEEAVISQLPQGNNLFNSFSETENINGSWRKLDNEQVRNFSKLGRILFLEEKIPIVKESRNYTILIWKYGPFLQDRHMKQYSDEIKNPFALCSVKNCKISYKDESLDNADLVIIHLQRTKNVDDIPKIKHRNENQIWAFLTDESPYHTFMSGKPLKDFNNVFNWSMTYRMDSDIPVPYGRTNLRNQPLNNSFNVYQWLLTKKHDVHVAILGSNCGSKNHRWEYVKELSKHIRVDTYGKCGKLKCPGHFRKDCPEISKYIFYLSFENSNCDEYITEKLWWNAYHKHSIPIVMGTSSTSYGQLLPPHSYINVDNFATPRDLATYLTYLVTVPSELQQYFQWKNYFKVMNEHGYFQSNSYHYCRACEALNYNSKEKKVYKDLESFWSVKRDCHPAWDAT